MSVIVDILNDTIGDLIEELFGRFDDNKEFIERFVELRTMAPTIDSEQLFNLLQEDTF